MMALPQSDDSMTAIKQSAGDHRLLIQKAPPSAIAPASAG